MNEPGPGPTKASTRRSFLLELLGGWAALVGMLALRRPAAPAAPAARARGPIDNIFEPMRPRKQAPREK
jgi:hypothetical protein